MRCGGRTVATIRATVTVLRAQEPVLFAGSVADNIRYGMPEETSLEEVEAAARTANAAEFVARLPEG